MGWSNFSFFTTYSIWWANRHTLNKSLEILPIFSPAFIRLRSTGSWEQSTNGCLSPSMSGKPCFRDWRGSFAPYRRCRRVRPTLLRIRPLWTNASAFSSKESTCCGRTNDSFHRHFLTGGGKGDAEQRVACVTCNYIFEPIYTVPKRIRGHLNHQ